MDTTAIYVIAVIYRDGVSIVHPRCFAQELAARCEVEAMAEGTVDWLTLRYGTDERQTEFEVQQLFMWRYAAEHAA